MNFILVLAIILELSSEGLAIFKFTRGNRYRIHHHIFEDLNSSRIGNYCEEKWFIQLLNHYNAMETRTWKQRYFVNDEFYKEGGPIFLMVNGEQDAQPAWLSEDASLEMYLAKEFGAKVIMLEHRFYGMSRPTEDLSDDNIVYLSVDQALADVVYFIKGMQKTRNFKTKWILFGASYGGSLVTWMRAKYPHLVHGAIANSAPLLAQVDFEGYYLVAQNVLLKHSTKCFSALAAAFKKVHSMLHNQNYLCKLGELFNFCGEYSSINDSIYNKIFFYEEIVDVASEVVFNNGTYDLTIEKACDIMENVTIGEPVERLALVKARQLESTGLNCLSFEKYEDFINRVKLTVWDDDDSSDRRWIYQSCTEFGWYPTTTGRPFGIPVNAIPVSIYKKLCTDVFGSRYKRMLDFGIERTNLIYGGLDVVNAMSNIVFVHGSNDPWHAAGVISSSNPKSPVLYVEGAGHCPLIYPPKEDDSPEIAQAIRQTKLIIKQWLLEQ